MQFNPQALKLEGRQTLILAFPLIIGQLSQMMTYLADTVMIGRLGTVPLAAATFGNTLLHVPFLFGMGMVTAVSIRVSQARGANDPVAARAALRHGMYLSLSVGLLTVVLAWIIQPILPIFRQKPEVIAEVPTYFMLVALSMVPAIGGLAVKSHADAMNHPWPAFFIVLGGVIANIFMNWLFIYGHWGAPRMELAGAGLATLLSRILSFAGLVFWCSRFPPIRDWVPNNWFRVPDWVALKHLIKVGLPASLQLLAEVSAFVFATIVIGTLGPAALASHQVAISCAATVFMVPLGLSMALTVRVGEAWGAKTVERIRPIVMSGWILAAGFSMMSALCFLLFNEQMAQAFVKDETTIRVAAALLLVAAAFQISDTMQIVSSGGLRGMDDVTVPAWIAFGAYWVFSLPVGWLLAFPGGMGVVGMWWGITLGLTLTAIALGIRLWKKSRVPDATPEPIELDLVESEGAAV